MTTSIPSTSVAATLAAFLLFLPPGATAQEYLSIEIEEGQLTPELRTALNRVVSPSVLETVIAEGISDAVTTEALCDRINCSSSTRESITRARGGATEGGVRLPSLVAPGSGRDFDTTQTYVVLNRDDPLLRASDIVPETDLSTASESVAVRVPEPVLREAMAENAGVLTGMVTEADAETTRIEIDDQTFVMPEERGGAPMFPQVGAEVTLFYREEGDQKVITQMSQSHAGGSNAPAVGATWLEHGEGHASSLIEQDMAQLGATSRQFPIAPSASEEEIARVVELAQGSGAAITFPSQPANQFEIQGLQSGLTFEAGSSDCTVTAEDWPYDVDQLAATLAFNQAVLDRMRIGHIRRSNILIIDTGLGEALAQTDPFQRFLYLDTGELLYSNVYHADSSLSESSQICLDVDRNLETSDAYGFAPNEDKIRCQTHSPRQLIAPIPRLEGDRLPPYAPEHGSFVGGLAVGGPDLIAAAPGLDRFIGLTFARVTRLPEADTQSVKTEIPDLQAALVLASKREVDVINASFRVTDPNHRRTLVDALEEFEGVIVAAAGNFSEELSDDSRSFPAAVTGRLRRGEHLIVVGAIQPDAQTRLWPNSAFSDDLVDIAAPGVNLVSFNEAGARVCMSGTSAAAPLVTFAAGLLHAMGITRPSEIRRRILASADLDPSLEEVVAGGRVLNLTIALDVFADHIWLEGEDGSRRVHLQRPDGDETKPVLLPLCKRGAGLLNRSNGVIDAAMLVYWRRVAQGEAELWHRLNDDISEMGKTCDTAEAEIAFHDLVTGATQIVPLSSIRRIVPSPLRSALAEARAEAALQ